MLATTATRNARRRADAPAPAVIYNGALNDEQRARWAAIDALPVAENGGDLEDGMCACGRIVYTLTGDAGSHIDCVSQIVLGFFEALCHDIPAQYRARLATAEVRDRLLATTPADDERLRWVAAEMGRQGDIALLKSVFVTIPAEVHAFEETPPITSIEIAKSILERVRETPAVTSPEQYAHRFAVGVAESFVRSLTNGPKAIGRAALGLLKTDAECEDRIRELHDLLGIAAPEAVKV